MTDTAYSLNPQADVPAHGRRSNAQRMLRAFIRNRAAVAGMVLAAVVVAMAVLAPWLAPHNPVRQSAVNRLKPPGPEYTLGTDRYGRDVMSRVLWGSRVSLQVGVGAVVLAIVLGVPMGVVAGYKGGRYDQLLMRLADVLLSFPTLVLGLIILALLGPGLWKMILTIGIVIAPKFARMARGPTMSLRETEFVMAARANGSSDLRIMVVHIMPNVIGDVMVVSTLWLATAIRTEANLSFLGLGVAPPTPSWGNMVREGIDFLGTAPWLAIVPAVAIFVAILAFNMIGDGFRDVADPRAHG